MSKRAVISVSMNLIHHLLNLPNDVEVLHSTIGNYGLTLDVVITAPDMANAIPLATPPTVYPLYEHRDGFTRLVSLDYPRERDCEVEVVPAAKQ